MTLIIQILSCIAIAQGLYLCDLIAEDKRIKQRKRFNAPHDINTGARL